MDAYQTSTEHCNTARRQLHDSLYSSLTFSTTHTHTLQQCMLQHSSSKSIHSTASWKQVQQQFDYICAAQFVNCLTCLVTQYICVPVHTVWQFTKQTWLGKQSFTFMEALCLWFMALQRSPGAAGGLGLCVTQQPEVLLRNVLHCTVAFTCPASHAFKLLPHAFIAMAMAWQNTGIWHGTVKG